jgi:hypothetical protein
MKKKLNQKLSLNKMTVANLTKNEMADANGGYVYPSLTCTVTITGPFACRISIVVCPDPEDPTEFTYDGC